MHSQRKGWYVWQPEMAKRPLEDLIVSSEHEIAHMVGAL
jgi:hypothetical protein